jgi:hypothetical protein
MFRPIWPSSGVKVCLLGKLLLLLLLLLHLPQMIMYVCNMCEISLEFCVCEVLCVSCGYLFVYSL